VFDFLRARRIELMWEGERIRAHIGSDPVGIDGFGATVLEAPRDLANQIEAEKEISIWVPQGRGDGRRRLRI
jgi:hypothetical protein